MKNNILTGFFSAALDAMIMIDQRGVIVLVNPSTEIIFGYTSAELVGKNVSILMPEPHASNHDQYLQQYLRSRQPAIVGKSREEYGKRKDGTIFPMRLSVSEMVVDGEKYFAGVIQDNTLIHNAREEIERMNYRLEQKVARRTKELEAINKQLTFINNKLAEEVREREIAENLLKEKQVILQVALEKEKELNELKSRFVSMASHEFRTPLSTILSSAGLLAKYPLEEQQLQRLRHIERIKGAVNMLTGILDDFLSLAKLDEGHITVTPSVFSLDELMYEIREGLKSNLKPGQEIELSIDQQGINLHQDASLLKNLLYNLVSNAIKYSPENLSIQLKVHKTDSKTICIEVRDFGIGIPRHDQQHLFTRFFRAKNAINIQGTGLGLNIVRHYTNLMGGQVTFESEEGVGTVFYVSIPIALHAPS